MHQLRDLTLGALLCETVDRYPERPAILFGDDVTTYAELYQMVCTLARAFLALGITKGDRVAVWETERPRTVVCLYALWLIGAVTVLPNTGWKGAEIKPALISCQCKMLFYSDGYKDVAFASEIHAVEPFPEGFQTWYIGSDQSSVNGRDWDSLLRLSENSAPKRLESAMRSVYPQDPATVIFTSGTMGHSKGVLTSHRARCNSALFQGYDLGALPTDRFLMAIPIFHCFSLTVNLLSAMTCGACTVLTADRHTQTLLATISKHRCTVFCAVPTVFSAICAHKDLAEFDLSSLRIGLIGGSGTSPERLRLFRDRLGFELLPSLGLTECTAGITVASPEDSLETKLYTVGHFMEHIEGRIVDPATGQVLPTGSKGEIAVRGYCTMMGYEGLPDETARAFDDEGFLHTSDIGFIDENGQVHLCGRLKRMILRGGENIDPVEIEDRLAAWHAIRKTCCVGIPDAHYGEEICAIVCPAEDGLTPDNVRSYINTGLSAFKQPRYVLFWEDLPETASGKPMIAQIERMAREELGIASDSN